MVVKSTQGFNRKPIAWDKRLRGLPINVESFPNRPGYVNILHGITYAKPKVLIMAILIILILGILNLL